MNSTEMVTETQLKTKVNNAFTLGVFLGAGFMGIGIALGWF